MIGSLIVKVLWKEQVNCVSKIAKIESAKDNRRNGECSRIFPSVSKSFVHIYVEST